jgi:hypothetical protein
VNQVREFFELPETILWVTIEDGDLWWCVAEPEVQDIYTGDEAVEEREVARLLCATVIDTYVVAEGGAFAV